MLVLSIWWQQVSPLNDLEPLCNKKSAPLHVANQWIPRPVKCQKSLEVQLGSWSLHTAHPDHVVPDLEQYYNTGFQNWILNLNHPNRDHPSFTLLDVGSTLQPVSTDLQSSPLVYCVCGWGLPHSESIHSDHDHEPWRIDDKNSITGRC